MGVDYNRTKTISTIANMKQRFWFSSFFLISSCLLKTDTVIPLSNFVFTSEPHPECIKVSPNGNICISDKTQYQIKVYSGEGVYLHAIGGRGQGPGEFAKWFGEFAIGSDSTLYQADFYGGNKRITRFSPLGKLVDSIALKADKNIGVYRIFPLTNRQDGLLLGITDKIMIEERNSLIIMGLKIVFAIVKSDGSIGSPILSRQMDISFSDEKQSGWPNIPFFDNLLSAYCPSTDTLVCQKASEDAFTLIKTGKGQVKNIKNHFQSRKINPKDFDNFMASEKSDNPSFNMLKELYQLYIDTASKGLIKKPFVKRIFFNSSGSLFIVADSYDGSGFIIHKFSPSGEFKEKEKYDLLPYHVDDNTTILLKNNSEEDQYELILRKTPVFFLN